MANPHDTNKPTKPEASTASILLGILLWVVATIVSALLITVAAIEGPAWWRTHKIDPRSLFAQSENADDEPGTASATPSVDAAPSTLATPVVYRAVRPDGNAFMAYSDDGVQRRTLAVVLGKVPHSARGAAGLSEEIWLQGVHADEKSGAIVDLYGKAVHPADIRDKIGTSREWVSLYGYQGVAGKCIPIQADNNSNQPEACSL